MESIEEVIVPKVKGKPGRKPKQPVEGVDLVALLSQLGENQKETLIALAAELRKPTEIEQKKLDEEKESIRKRTINAVAAAREGERITLVKQSNCNHMQGNNGKTDGISTFGGQVNSNGYWVARCGKCFVQTLPIKATTQELQGGVNLRSWQNVSLEGLNRLAIQRDPSVADKKVA
jgi:hypothetical protein